MNRQKIEQRIEVLKNAECIGNKEIAMTWEQIQFLQSLLDEPEKPRSAWHNGQTYKFHGFFQGKNFSEELCPVAVLEDERGDITTEPANTIRIVMTNQETGYESKHKKTIEGAILRLRTDCREGAGTSPEFLEDVDMVLRHLESLKPTPLDAPTHSGWWWSSKAGNWPLYYNHDEGMINDRGMWLPAASFLGGKWLPANNPFREEQL